MLNTFRRPPRHKPRLPLTPVVYSMGKVATSAISSAMLRAGLPVHHIHTLNDKKLLNAAERAVEQGSFPPPHICESMAWKNRLFSDPQKCLYITLVREPVSRNLSAFFENIGRYFPKGLDGVSPEAILQTFITKYNHKTPLTWLDNEYKDELGIDVYALEFDIQKRYVRLPDCNMVVFRSDCEDEIMARILSDILGPKLIVTRENDSTDKDYVETYSAVKKIARFSDAFLDKMYNTKYARHFWSAEEISEFRKRWQKPSAN